MHVSLISFLSKVWNNPLLDPNASLKKLTDDIYDLYTPKPPNGIKEDWDQTTFNARALQENRVYWRIYISVKGYCLMHVWNMLLPTFEGDPGVAAAKHTTPEAADSRVDTIVVYLLTASDKERLIKKIKALFNSSPGQGGAPSLPPRLNAEHFKTEIPPTTYPEPGLKGFASAEQPLMDGWMLDAVPDQGLSFGYQLAELVAPAYQNAVSLDDLKLKVKENFIERGMDINKPWQQVFSMKQREAFRPSFHAALKALEKRGKYTGNLY